MTSLEFIAHQNTEIVWVMAGLIIGYLIVVSVFSFLRKVLP